MTDIVANTCNSCSHWLPPSERTDFRGPLDHDYDPDLTMEQCERAHLKADLLLGECSGVPFYPTPSQLPSPPAAIVDASQKYSATLYTGADFFCALWAKKEKA